MKFYEEKLLKVFNLSWKTEKVPATHGKKFALSPAKLSYRPISLTTVINRRLT
jgi:hypothetical protein